MLVHVFNKNHFVGKFTQQAIFTLQRGVKELGSLLPWVRQGRDIERLIYALPRPT